MAHKYVLSWLQRIDQKGDAVNLGQFSISLAVKNLANSKSFYEALGFTAFGGAIERDYLIMKQGETLIGLFQGMFENNILTFNPGWDSSACKVDPLNDVRELQALLLDKEIALDEPHADPEGKGPAHFILHDPDGNMIKVDQHR